MKETQQSQSISQYLKGANYPADREELQRTIKRNGAPNDVVDRINSLPNQRFNTENDVTNAFNQGGAGGSQGGQTQGSQSGQAQGSQRQSGQAQGGQGNQGDTERQGNVGQGGATGGTQGKTTQR